MGAKHGTLASGSAFFLVKPASGRCNLACRYCFYRDLAGQRSVEDFGLMPIEVSDLLVDRAFELGAERLAFGFQGGEPTLAGLPFYERFVERVRAGAARAAEGEGRRIDASFALQTNGLLIDQAWAEFLARERFLVGVSIDGPRLLHDLFRIGRDGSGSHAAAMRGAVLLREAGAAVNALCVVDAATADNVGAVYRHLRGRGFDWIQFIPCLDPLGEEPGGHDWSLSPEAYGRFLTEAFDIRYEEWTRGLPVSVRWFDELVGMAMGRPPESCWMRGSCSVNFAVEADGSVYPCDFYMTDEWKLGSLRSESLGDMRNSAAARRFIGSSATVDPACRNCFAWALCRGGCRRDREPFLAGAPGKNRYCASFKRFFAYAGERIMEMAEVESEKARERAASARGAGPQSGSLVDPGTSRSPF